MRLLIFILLLPFSAFCQSDTLQLDSSQVILNVCGSLPDSVDSSEVVYDLVDKEPEYPGGEGEMMRFIAANFDIQTGLVGAGGLCYHGKAYISFIVEKGGGITDVKCLRGVCEPLDNAAIEVVKKMPNWIPGEINGNSVRVRYTLPIQVCYR